MEQFKNVYSVSKSAINTTIQKYSIIEQQAKLMNNNISLVNELGDYIELLNVYAPKHKARGEEVMKLLHNIRYKLDPKINATFYLYN